MKKFIKIAYLGSLAAPFLALAQGAEQPNFQFFENLLRNFQSLLGYVVPILVALAVIYFLWGVLKFIMAGASEDSRKEARGMMIWGIVAIFVMVSVWGLVRFLQGITGIETGSAIQGPELPSGSTSGSGGGIMDWFR